MGRYIMRFLGVGATLLGGYLLYRVVGRYDFDAIAEALRSVPPQALAIPLALVVVSFLSLSLHECIAVRYASGASVSFARVAKITFCALGIGHSIGMAALSSGAVRYRMYSRSGIGVKAVAKILLFSATTVTLGFTTLIAIGLVVNHQLVISVLDIDRAYTLVLALALASVPALYLVLCAVRRRPLNFGHFRLRLPRPAIGAAQIVFGSANLLLKSAVLYAAISLFTEADYLTVASLYVAGDAAAVIGHVPGGWGVLEYLVLAELSGAGAAAGLLVFRVIYYLTPLLLGLGIFVGDEILRRRQGNGGLTLDDASDSPLRYVQHVPHR